ncbi:MAG TPA: molybdopterin-dependent oxidoreductase [Candidatus Angelobacter sp.]|jgi:anaerobic selenocysteine-containing dehydrogenase|nr:molybdopterin-dependent oxidoreductase [Candidatus Angelobacter sp.]
MSIDGTATVICPLCEATCGLTLDHDDQGKLRLRGNDDDVFSRGFICPKGVALADLHDDPDRLRTPLVRRDGRLVECTWDEAFEAVERGLGRVIEEHGRHAVAVYLGNAGAHSLSLMLYLRSFLAALGSRNLYTASSVDQMPKQVSGALMFGSGAHLPVPDLDRTDHLVILGANPYASNGSLMTAPDMPGRLRDIRRRGGKVVVVDPRRTQTAKHADEHVFIRPGTDAFLLAAMAHTLFDENLVDLGRLQPHVSGVEEVRALVEHLTPEAVATHCGVDAQTIRRMTREFAAAPTGAIYGRIGTCTQEFGTLASWLVDVVNVLSGHFDSPGGAMFTLPATGGPTTRGASGRGKGAQFGRWTTRVRNLPESFGELPVAALAEEIDVPGDGQIRALVTVGGNPCVSTPNVARLTGALESLDFMVSLDLYLHETVRLADVVLPAPSPLEQPHYDVLLNNLAVRNNARWADPAIPLPATQLPEWETLLRLAAAVAPGDGTGRVDKDVIEQLTITRAVELTVHDEGSRIFGRDREEILAALGDTPGPERLIDLALRSGPYGDGFGTNPGGLTLQQLRDQPNGVDLGPLQPRIPETLRTRSGTIELAPQPLLDDAKRLRQRLAETRGATGMVLIGRRDLRSNNSWMHNIEMLVRGKPRCTLYVNPQDAERLQLQDGGQARVSSRVGTLVAPVEVTDEIMPGVVSLPHGWGHGQPGTRQSVAAEYAGVNSNLLTDETLIDPLSGNAVLNGIPVQVELVETALV